jgi:hypothetical protein
MLDVCYLEKLNMKLFVIKVAKCKKVVFWFPYKITTTEPSAKKATYAKYESGNWPLFKFFEYFQSTT